MGRKLTAGVVVRHPSSGVTTFLPPGSDLPDWAGDLVGDHALEGDVRETADLVGDDTSSPTRGRPKRPRD